MEILKISAANRLKKAKNGHTLLELLAVVTVLLFIFIIAIFQYRIYSNMKEQYMVNELVEIIEYLRNDAIVLHRNGVIYARIGEDFCKYYSGRTDIDREEKKFSLESGWKFDNYFKIIFTPSGAPVKGASIYLLHTSGKRYHITVEPANSMVRVKKVK